MATSQADVQEFTFSIPAAHPSLAGHFPGNPLVPGVLVLDEVISGCERAANEPLKLRGIPMVKFVSSLRAGQLARVRVERTAPEQIRFTVHHGEILVAQGALAVGSNIGQ